MGVISVNTRGTGVTEGKTVVSPLSTHGGGGGGGGGNRCHHRLDDREDKCHLLSRQGADVISDKTVTNVTRVNTDTNVTRVNTHKGKC